MQETRLAKIQKFFRSPGGHFALYLIIPVVIFTIIAIAVISGRSAQKTDSIKIDNFSELLPNVPEDTRDRIENKLYEKIASSLPENAKVPTSGAMINPESLYSISVPTSFVSGDFEVNIESIDQSYIVTYFYGVLEGARENEGDVSVSIYDIDDPNFAHAEPIQYILPRDFPDDYFSISYTLSSESKSGYRIIVTMNPPEAIYEEASIDEFKANVEQKVNEFLKSRGLNPEDYKFYYKYKIIK